MNLNEEQLNEENIDSENIDSENINSENIDSEKVIIGDKSIIPEYDYKFGWSSYSEITNGRFAMLGFLAIILIELVSKQSFLKWAGIF